MKRDDLRKVKWFVRSEYYYKDEKLTEEQAELYDDFKIFRRNEGKDKLIEQIGEENFNLIKETRLYNTGYFHRWIVERWGNEHEGFSTYTFALVETEEGVMIAFKPERITFIS